MIEATKPSAPKWLITASVILGLFVLLDLGLFGWLMFRSLSAREIRRVLLETRLEAEGLARQIAGRAEQRDGDLYTAVATVREVQTYIDEILAERQLVQTVEIRDQEGKLVFRSLTEAEVPDERVQAPLEIPVGGELERREDLSHQETFSLEDTAYDLAVPIGSLGFLHIGISRGELDKRISVLRRDLLNTTSLAALLTLVVLLLAYVVIWRLWKRGENLERQAAEAERMAYVGTLASGLAHEIRNPLNSVSLNMQLLQEELALKDGYSSSNRLFSLTRAEIDRLGRLVSSFLQYARPRPLNVERVEVQDLLVRCRDLLAAESRVWGGSIHVEESDERSRIAVDPEQITQLLLNLVQNGLAAGKAAGKEPVVRLRAFDSGSWAAIEVEDNGGGIPSVEMEKVFDLFYSTRKGGTGLGLAIVDRIVKSHGGEVELENLPGSGTKVRVLLPLNGSSQGRAARPA